MSKIRQPKARRYTASTGLDLHPSQVFHLDQLQGRQRPHLYLGTKT